MPQAGTAFVDVLPRLERFGAELQKQIGPKLQALGKSISSVGSKLTRNLTLPIVGVGAAAIKAFTEQEKVVAQTEAVVKSTGGLANVSADALGALAANLQSTTAFGDEAVQAGGNLLLTFTNIRNEVGAGNDIFAQTTRLMLDVSQAMGQDLKTSAIQLGKALNDPVKGMASLGRVGIQFSEDQKAVIESLVESGDLMGAQKVILAELEKQFGGSAKAFAKTSEGSFRQAMNALGDAGESLGEILVPVLAKIGELARKLADWFTNLSPAGKKALVTFLAVAAAIGPILFVLGKLISSLGVVIKVFGILTQVLAANPYVAIIAATIAIVALIVANWEKVKAFLVGVWDAIVGGLKAAWNAIPEFFRTLWDKVLGLVRGALSGLKSAISTGVAAAVEFFRRLPGKIVGFLVGLPAELFDLGVKFLKGLLKGIKEAAAFLWTFFRELPERILEFFSDAGTWLYEAGRAVMQGFWDGIKEGWDKVVRAGLELIGQDTQGQIDDALGIGSPSKVLRESGRNAALGFALGLEDGLARVGAAASTLATDVRSSTARGRRAPVVAAAGGGAIAGSIQILDWDSGLAYLAGRIVTPENVNDALTTAISRRSRR